MTDLTATALKLISEDPALANEVHRQMILAEKSQDPDDLLELVTANGERLILKELLKAYPEYVHRERIISAVYGYRDLEDPENLLNQQVSRLRSRIASSPFQITTTRYVGLRLERRQSVGVA